MTTNSFSVPFSSETVQVRIIDTTSWIDNLDPGLFYQEEIDGYETFCGPSFSFLIEHPSGRTLLFDLGIDKNWRKLSPPIVKLLDQKGWKISVEKNVQEILGENGISPSGIEAIIWSHWHWDHTGDPSTFDPSTTLIVGPGFKKAFVPAWPTNPQSLIRESDYQGRELREVTFDSQLKVGRFNAIDYFDDGSFYILDAPGHAVGHLCALARVSSSPSTFIFMGGDAAHHAGEFRPSKYLTLPNSISPHPFDRNLTVCPGELFERILRDGDPNKPIFSAKPPPASPSYDHELAEETLDKLAEADGDERVFTILAHDKSIIGVADMFPKYVDDFAAQGWATDCTWRFLEDFKQAVS